MGSCTNCPLQEGIALGSHEEIEEGFTLIAPEGAEESL